MDSYRQRKAERVAEALRQAEFRNTHERCRCYSCNGSGHYDHNGSPRCAACNGTGRGWRLRTRPATDDTAKEKGNG